MKVNPSKAVLQLVADDEHETVRGYGPIHHFSDLIVQATLPSQSSISLIRFIIPLFDDALMDAFSDASAT